nr:hypothetical protein BgiMline_030051 [Biomphalaria glabrata]
MHACAHDVNRSFCKLPHINNRFIIETQKCQQKVICLERKNVTVSPEDDMLQRQMHNYKALFWIQLDLKQQQVQLSEKYP